MADKQILRNVYLEKRIFLSKDEFDLRNALLQRRVLDFLKEKECSSLHTFLPIKKKKEVDTLPIIELLKAKQNKLNFFVSKSLPKGKLEHYKLEDSTVLEKNKWGIPEPTNSIPVDVKNVDIIFIPLITFDKKGHRIGYGKGYYDRFLQECPNALKVGLTLAPPLDIIPYVESTDITMDWCITPFEDYQF